MYSRWKGIVDFYKDIRNMGKADIGVINKGSRWSQVGYASLFGTSQKMFFDDEKNQYLFANISTTIFNGYNIMVISTERGSSVQGLFKIQQSLLVSLLHLKLK